jgi:hypothetical protein
LSHTPPPADPRPTPLWLGWVIDAAELDPDRWAEERRRGRRHFLRRSRLLGWTAALACLAWQLSLVRHQGGGLTRLLTTGDPALLSVGSLLLILIYMVGATRWWLHERKYRRLRRDRHTTNHPTVRHHA